MLGFIFFIANFSFAKNSYEPSGNTPFDYESIYIYNFTKYIYWPNRTNQITIGVVGNPAAVLALKNMAEKKNNNNIHFEIKYFQTISHITDCQILFVTPEYTSFLPIIKQKIQHKSVLLVTEAAENAANQSSVNLIWNKEHTKLAFTVDKKQIENLGLKISSKLLSLAKE